MQTEEAIKLLIELERSIPPNLVNTDYDRTIIRARMIVKKIFGGNSDYLRTLDEIKHIHETQYLSKEMFVAIKDIGSMLRALFSTMQEDLKISDRFPVELSSEVTSVKLSNKIFIVHGHDDAMKQAVARMLEKIDLDPIILHEKPNSGRTIIEKFSDYADVSFAIILLSPDDLGYSKNNTNKKAMFRARQNVILELGYFLGKLGRAHVVALHTTEKNFEIPSDYSGVLFLPFDDFGQWRFDLIKELQACGFNVDANKLTR